MFEIKWGNEGQVILVGRFDASRADAARGFLDGIQGATTLDFGQLEYISSAGLGVLLRTQQRLKGGGAGLRLIHVNPHIRDVFHYAGFDQIFEIEPGSA